MSIYTYGVENVAVTKKGIVRTTNLHATYAGHLHDVVAAVELENGMNVKIGDHVTAEGRECVAGTFPKLTDEIVLIADVVKIYDASTSARAAEYNFSIPANKPAKGYQIIAADKFGVADYMFTTKVGDKPAIGNYVVVDGNGKWKEQTAVPAKDATGFIGKIYGYDSGDFETIVLVEVLQNVQL